MKKGTLIFCPQGFGKTTLAKSNDIFVDVDCVFLCNSIIFDRKLTSFYKLHEKELSNKIILSNYAKSRSQFIYAAEKCNCFYVDMSDDVIDELAKRIDYRNKYISKMPSTVLGLSIEKIKEHLILARSHFLDELRLSDVKITLIKINSVDELSEEFLLNKIATKLKAIQRKDNAIQKGTINEKH